MKKTIAITLTLCGVAAAATTGSATFSGDKTYAAGATFGTLALENSMTTGVDTGIGITMSPSVDIKKSGTNYANNYTVSIWVDTASLSSNQVLFGYTGTWSSNATGYSGLTWNTENKSLTLGRGEWKYNANSADTFTYYNQNNGYSTISNLGDKLTVGMTNITLAVTCLNSYGHQQAVLWINGEKIDTFGYYYGDLGNLSDKNNTHQSASYFVGDGSYGSISITTETLTTAESIAKLAGARIVPEPTTATLSLLALAGLAARRRRR